MARMPYFPFYPDDYISSPGVTTCDLIDEAVYLRLLAYSWKHEGCQLPDDMKYLRRLCKGVKQHILDRVLNRHFIKIELSQHVFVWRNSRLHSEFCKSMKRREEAKESAKVRWDKEKADAKAMPTQCERNAIQNHNHIHKKNITPIGHQTPMTGFEEFWKVYPRKVSKASALKAWKKIPPESGLVEKIVSAVLAQKKTEQWLRDDGKFIPHAATWLNGKRWEDELGTGGKTRYEQILESVSESSRAGRIPSGSNRALGINNRASPDGSGHEILDGEAEEIPEVENI